MPGPRSALLPFVQWQQNGFTILIRSSMSSSALHQFCCTVLWTFEKRQKAESMNKQYVEQREDVYWITGTRVSLDSIVYAFLEGQTAESIAQSFPVLTLEQVYGAITFYLANRPDIDVYLRCEEAEFETLRQAWRTQDPMFYQKMADARRQRQTIQP